MRMRPKQRQRGGGIAEVAHADEGFGIADDQARVAKADEGDEESDAAGHRGVKFVGNGAQNHLLDATGGDREKYDAGEKDRAQGSLPGNVHLEADGVGEVGIEAHAGGQGDGIAGDNAHQNGAEGSRQAGGHSGSGQRNSGSRKDGRIDQHDVGHRQEGSDAGQNLGAPIGSQMGKFEVGFKVLEHRRVLLGKHMWGRSQRRLCSPRAIAFEKACVGIWRKASCAARKRSKETPQAAQNVAGAKAWRLFVVVLRPD